MALYLRFRLQSGMHSVPLQSVHRVAAFAALDGEPQDYFLGWLGFHGRSIPVFDLNRVVCDAPTPETFGSRIMVLEAAPDAPAPFIGLLAAGVTDITSADDPAMKPLDLNGYLPLLYALIPDHPGERS